MQLSCAAMLAIRPATLEDAPAIQAIYAHHVVHGFGTFEEEAPTAREIARRMDEVIGRDMPWLVLEDEGGVRAYAYAMQFRPRSAYRFTVEDSVYCAPDAVGRGYGKAALSAVIEACRVKGLRQMIAAIGDAGNAASIGLHRTLGFEQVGHYSQVGFKHGRWLDVVLMQRALCGGSEPPSPVP